MPDYQSMTAVEIANAVTSGELSAVEIAKQALALAETVGKELNAFVTLCHDKALKQADAIDNLSTEEKRGLALCGVPVGLKDNICYSDYLTSCGSHVLDGFVPPYDATCVTRLIAAGAVIIGKTNMDEFGMGSTNENSFYGPVLNPVCPDCVPGGSSGGSAAVVAAGIVPLAFGSETGGSVRQPSSFCGLFGLKPSYGSVSRYGLVAYGSSLDQIGPMARTTADLALALGVVAGWDEMDSTSSKFEHPDYAKELRRAGPFRFGVPAEYFSEALDPGVERVVRGAIAALERAGHSFEEVSLPLTDKGVAAYYVTASAEASSNLARFDGVRYGLREGGRESLQTMYSDSRTAGFSDEVKIRIMLGTYVLSEGHYDAYYGKAAQVRAMMRRDFERLFEKVDLLIAPTTPTAAYKRGEKTDDSLSMYRGDVYTVAANLAGVPAISVPFGLHEDGRPVGVQIIGPACGELSLLQAANLLEGLIE